jgi:hypothetical protein
MMRRLCSMNLSLRREKSHKAHRTHLIQAGGNEEQSFGSLSASEPDRIEILWSSGGPWPRRAADIRLIDCESTGFSVSIRAAQ